MKRTISLLTVIAVVLCVVLSMTSCGCEKTGTGACEYAESRDVSERDVKYVEICIRGYGRIVLLLDATTAPITVANFISLAEQGFYDGLAFHRIVKDFMIQGGDPNGDGSGGSGNNIKGEFSVNGWVNDISHKKGVISMARNSGDNNSASSQFFICSEDSEFLDKNYAAFGYVVEGMSVVEAVENDCWAKTAYFQYYGTMYHSIWENYGNGAVVNDADKPVIKHIRVLENY